jgi:integrase/recombinase XerC
MVHQSKNPTQLVSTSSEYLRTLPLNELVDKVLDLVDVKESSRSTYKYGIRDFLSWNSNGQVDATTVVRYKKYLRDRTDIGVSTKNLYLSGVRLFLRRVHELGVTERDFSKGVKGFGITRGVKKSPITDEEVTKVFSFLKKSEDPRMVLVFSLLYLQGLRQKEVLTVQVQDYDRDTQTLWIEGKGRDDKERIDLHPKTVEVLDWFLSFTGIRSGYLLSSTRNPLGHISRIQLGRLIRGVHKSCRITNSGHGWRKVYTSKLIDSGMDLLTVSSFTRHRSIEMLKTYYDRLDRQKKLPMYYEVFDSDVVRVDEK